MAAFHLNKDLIANVMDIGQQSEFLMKVAYEEEDLQEDCDDFDHGLLDSLSFKK